MNILTHTYDIIILTETWLHSEILQNEFIDSRYLVHRSDRDRVRSGRRDGGGVLIAVLRSHYSADIELRAPPSSCAPLALSPLLDHALVELRLGKSQLIISAVYIPPRVDGNVYITYFNIMQEFLLLNNFESFLLAGDFNLPQIEWQIDGMQIKPSEAKPGSPHSCLLNFMSSCNCTQINIYKNSNNRLLDLCITSISNSKVYSVSAPLVSVDKQHPPFYIMIPVDTIEKPLHRKPQNRYCFREADYELINTDLSIIDWNNLFINKTAEVCLDFFYETLFKIIRKRIPCKLINPSRFPKWFSGPLIHIFKSKNRAWVKWKKYTNESDYRIFAMYRDRFKKESKKCYNDYMCRVEDSIKDSVKYFWTYIKHRKNQSDIPDSLHYMDTHTNDPSGICNLFSTFFESTFQPSNIPESYNFNDIIDLDLKTRCYNTISNISFSANCVLKGLKTLNVTKSAGTDGIPPIFLKNTASSLHIPLHMLYNKCLSEGVCPSVWKSARITPVHKGGSRKDITNYRPISILPTLAKLFERLLHNTLYPLLHNTILPQQHGFVRRRSTITNLIVYVSDLFDNMDSNEQSDSVYTDFRKAFDRVDHKILLEKIAYNGIHGNLWRWFKSYITNRTQKVVINGYDSDVISITSGVPQGSILGPLLFILFINDINDCFLNCNYLLYADDLKLYRTIKDSSDHQSFQEDLDRFSEYCRINNLALSLDKCKCITFTKKRLPSIFDYTLCGSKLHRVQKITDLGVTLDSKLTLDIHVDNICSKAYKMYGFVMRSGNEFRRPSTFLHLFKSLIRSQLEYAVAIWDPLYEKYSDYLEKVQKKFLRCMHFKCYRSRAPYDVILDKYGMISLKKRRLQLQAMLLYDLCQSRYDCMDIIHKISYSVPVRPSIRTCRINRLFAHTRTRTNAGKRSPMYRLTDTYNKYLYHIDLFATSVTSYRNSVIDKLVNIVI